MTTIKWIKTWGALLVAVSALGLSAFAIYNNNVQYQEVIKPHALHDMVYDRLIILSAKIERAENDIVYWLNIGNDTSEYQNKLVQAKTLRNQAELAWDDGQYNDADKFITEAHDVLLKIPPPPPAEINWWLIQGIIAGVVLLLILSLLLARRAKEETKRAVR